MIFKQGNNLLHRLNNHWKFNGDSTDSIGGNNGADTDITYTAGKLNQAASFNGTTSKITLTNNILLDTSKSFSIHFFTKIQSYNAVIAHNGSGGVNYVGAIQSNRIYTQVDTATAIFNYNFSLNVWYDILFIYDKLTVSCYINNTLIGAQPISGTLDIKYIGGYGGFDIDGLVDEFSIWGRALNYEERLDLYNNGRGLDSYFFELNNSLQKNMISFHHFENLLDEVSNSNLGAINYNVLFRPNGIFNKAAYFDTAAWIDNVGDLDTYAYMHQTGVFSISCWIKFDAYNTVPQYIMGSSPTTIQEGFYIGNILHGGFSGALEFSLTNGISNEFIYHPIVDNFFTSNTWTHLAVVADNVNIYIYRNTILVGTFPKIDNLSPNPSFNKLNFGRINTFGLNMMNGYLDQTGFWDRTLTLAEIKKLYYKGFKTPTTILKNNSLLTDGLISAFNFNNNAQDEVNSFNGTVFGNLNYVTGINNKAAQFSAAQSTIIKDTNRYDFIQSTGRFTFNTWIKPDDNTTEGGLLTNNAGTPQNNGFFIDKVGSNLYVYIWANAVQFGALALGIFTTTDWQMVTVVGDGTQIKIYLDNVSVSLLTVGTWAPAPCSALFSSALGGFPDTNAYKYNGLMDSAYIWDRDLSDNEISELYNGGSAIYLPQITIINQPPDLLRGLEASWKFENSLMDATGNHDGVQQISGSPLTYQTGKIGQCINFDGSSFGFTFPEINITGDYTISFWIRVNGATTSYIFGKYPGLQTYVTLSSGNEVSLSNVSTNATVSVGANLVLNTWHMVTFTSKNNIGTAYLGTDKKNSTAGFTDLNFDTIGYFAFGTFPLIDIDNVSVWNRSLNPEELDYYYNKGQGLQHPF